MYLTKIVNMCALASCVCGCVRVCESVCVHVCGGMSITYMYMIMYVIHTHACTPTHVCV